MRSSAKLLARRIGYLAAVLMTALVIWSKANGAALSGPINGLGWVVLTLWFILIVAGMFNLGLYVIGFGLWLRRRLLLRSGNDDATREELEGLVRVEGGKEITSARAISSDCGIWARIALVMPVYHEQTERVYAGIRKTWQSLLEAGFGKYCDFYLLCDSTDPAIRAAEAEVHERLVFDFCGGVGKPSEEGATGESELGRIFLIRRRERSNYKAGNIANFLEQHGGFYDFMLVLDADSVMWGDTIRRMVLRMQENSKLAILQSTIVPTGAITPFARSMQYSLERTMPLFARGLYWLFGAESVYWGHNALIRVAPFLAHGSLPIMPGRAPLGGAIMSQDIVESGLLGRAGWAVEWEVDSEGSFDELPANVLAYGKRDRRWCQGNFQHFWLIFGDRMKLGHRLYFANGIFAYLTGPLLLCLMMVGFAQSLLLDAGASRLAFDGRFVGFLLVMVALPRALGIVRALWEQPRFVNSTKGAFGEIGSMLAEAIICILMAPSLFYLHARFVFEIVTGKSVQWGQQSRNPDDRLPWQVASRTFGPAAVFGVVWAIAGIVWAQGTVLYLAPVLIGWIFSIPLAVVTSSPEIGRFFVRLGLFAECTRIESASAATAEPDLLLSSSSPRSRTASHRMEKTGRPLHTTL